MCVSTYRPIHLYDPLFDRDTRCFLSVALPWCHGGCHSHHVAFTNLRYVPRRAVLYCPGNDERKLRKLASLRGLDCAVLDCEDGVALSKKTEARETIPRMLAELDLGRTEKCVRVNSVSSGLANADLQVILQAEVLPPALMLPKVEDAAEVQWHTAALMDKPNAVRGNHRNLQSNNNKLCHFSIKRGELIPVAGPREKPSVALGTR
ncbi:unnamed protein product [Oncorhynchus mykiss]|uniref:HpcH/HpaI aldolase/citrate lyase domain-containing protein n=1 Tax=Oncorhynchus mykiss TaxID=8022 RepID=A0A060WM62_ONCMY|nr:unnamed protein product [Oncorhynchus mykiss]